MKTEDWLKRRIELKKQYVLILNNAIGDLTRELLQIQGMTVNDQADYGGDGVKSLNSAPIFDPFVEG